MKNYKDYEKKYIGSSDIAMITLKDSEKSVDMSMHEDGVYRAYVVDGEAAIGSHYDVFAEFRDYLQVSDDAGVVDTFQAAKIIVYRAGLRGCIIQLIDEK